MAPPPPPTSFIFDLDGTILDTETLCLEVAEHVLATHGALLTPEAQKAALGKRPLDCWNDVAALLKLDEVGVTGQQLYDESEPLLTDRWCDAKLLPGAARLLRHLHAQGVPFAIATSTPRATFNKKLSKKPEILQLLQHVVCGDEVEKGKPHPDVFLAAARLLSAQPSDCLVFEDAPSGVEGAVAAGMRVVAVPSLVGCEFPSGDITAAQGCVQVLPSLLVFDPTVFGVPAFVDVIQEVIPLDDVIRIKGTVIKGFGRGSKELGVPTANVDSSVLRGMLAEAVSGIYCGYAAVGTSGQAYPMVMSIGWNPYYGNKQKTAEPWLLHKFEHSFYGEEIRLVLVGYVRPEANFTSLQALIDRIHKDGEVTKAALAEPLLAQHETDAFLAPPGIWQLAAPVHSASA